MQNLIEKNLYKKSLLSYLLLPLSIIYSCILIHRRKLHSGGFRSRCKIISVGNIVSGGSGKTPGTENVLETMEFFRATACQRTPACWLFGAGSTDVACR